MLSPKPASLEEIESGELPETYGTRELLAAPRDPRSLYVRWDFTTPELREHARKSGDHQLALRVYADIGGPPRVIEAPVPVEARHCFVPVSPPGSQFVAELGYYAPNKDWIVLASSEPVRTPRETPSDDRTTRFVTFLPELSPGGMLAAPEIWNPAVWTGASGEATAPETLTTTTWTPAHDEALAGAVGPRTQVIQLEGSAESMRLIPEEGGGDMALGSSAPTSPSGSPAQPGGGFWFRLNAELIVYGATEPDAMVSLGGQNIQLAPDGTFSCRFTLPDGEHRLVAIATSARGDVDGATLTVTRRTEPLGETDVPKS